MNFHSLSHSFSPPPVLRRFSPRLFSFTIRSNLPFSEKNAKYHRELTAAIDVVERACRLCVDVKRFSFSSDERILEKNDQTPVTVADFGVQALISLELGKLFPSIPLVAEEDSTFLRSNNLENSIVKVVSSKTTFRDTQLTESEVLEAIDRGANESSSFGAKPATYWILDPIDGTRGFVRGSDAMYVVGLALIVEGKIVLGVMGCPNWKEDDTSGADFKFKNFENTLPNPGVIMIAHDGQGTWKTQLPHELSGTNNIQNNWTRCSIDTAGEVDVARFCSPDSQSWESLPISAFFDATTDAERVNDRRIHLLPACCGSLCKYLMVASGRASVFIQRTTTQKVIKAWDHAVGIICVHEAGGKVTDWRGSKLDFAADQAERRILYPSGGILVTNSVVHDKLLQLIAASSSAA